MSISKAVWPDAIIYHFNGRHVNQRKPSLSGDEPVEIGDFIDFFPDTKLPYRGS